MKRLAVLLLLFVCSPLFAQSVYYSNNASHQTNINNAAAKLATALGGTATPFNAGDNAAWTSTALVNADVIFIGQSSETYNVTAPTRAAIADWVSNGGSLVVLRDTNNLGLLNSVLGSSMTLGQSGWNHPQYNSSKQPEVDGTSFDSAPAILSAAVNDWQAISPGTLAPEGIGAYVDAYGNIHVMVQGYGTGTVAYLAYDWCCDYTQQELDEWDAALFSSASFADSGEIGTATFNVTKTFLDGSTGDVEVTLTCNAGLPLTQTATIAGGDPQGVTFTVTNLAEAGADCEVTENNVSDAYTPVMNEGLGCAWENVNRGSRTCSIVNVGETVEFTVIAVWGLHGITENDVTMEAEVTITCNNPIQGGYGSGDYYFDTTLVGDGAYKTVTVDASSRAAECSADLVGGIPSYAQVSDDCDERTIAPGGSDFCTFAITLFFEGIPTLSQWGMAIMALLMLSVGLVGFRRFA